MKRNAFNDDWWFTPEWQQNLIGISEKDAEDSMESVQTPHTVCVTPFNNFDQDCYQKVSGYVKFFKVPEESKGSRIFICFDGAAHQTEVWCNGRYVGSHHNGYTAFRFELTDFLKVDEENQLCVKLDSREIDVPPFGGVIDYLTYGGLYREVWIEEAPQTYISDVFIRGTADGKFRCSVKCNREKKDTLQVNIYDKSGHLWHIEQIGPGGELSGKVRNARVWSLQNPTLYTANFRLSRAGTLLDEYSVRFGFRTIEFKKDGFYLNGEKILLRGLDRHQSWPYMGYAAPSRLQQQDAEMLKYDLGCNAVRTSHYPQSEHFINRCDEIGLLVFTELPGWQHIGNEDWQAQAVQNVREMVTQYRNHPSIILWGVRINESPDCDAFYRETNRVAHELDDSRPTGGVRNFRGSHLFEDVYTYNDFSHIGSNPGCEPKGAITSDPEKPYLVTEYMGHIFPSKPFDDEAHRTEHALRHARVLNDIAAQEDIAGSFGWCMFDYNTHREFGAGDGVCWHGVMDMFRNPKLAAAVYASQSDYRPVMEVSTSMDIGDWAAFGLTTPVVFTNASEVRLYRNQDYVKTFYPSKKFSSLRHPPIFIDDMIGGLLRSKEGYDKETAQDLKTVIYGFVRYAQEPFSEEMLAAKKRLNDAGISDKRITELQNRYMTYWGEDGIVSWNLIAIKGGKAIEKKTLTPGRKFTLDFTVDNTRLVDRGTWDVATVRLFFRDENGNIQPYVHKAVKLTVSGAISLIGPDSIPLLGGMAACYVRTRGVTGWGKLEISADGVAPLEINFRALKDKSEKRWE